MREKPLLHELVRCVLHFGSIKTAEAAEVSLEGATDIL